MTEPFRDRKQFATVQGKRMAYIDEGAGAPIVFLHGNPTSSYLWRNILPYMEGHGRLIAPDLIGMGDSDKLEDSGPESYGYLEHRSYLFDLLDQLGVHEDVTLVLHDWGSALGFHWAHQHPEALRGIAFMESIVAPVPSWDAFPEATRDKFQAFRSPKGEEMVLEKNLFVEAMLPKAILRDLTEAEMAEYRRPYAEPGEGRRPTLSWPRQVPVAGEPREVHDIVAASSAWLRESPVPKLWINGDPGALNSGATRGLIRSFPALSEVTVKGRHFLQEDSPDAIGTALRDWHAAL